MLAATELHNSWYLKLLKNTLLVLKKTWKQLHEYIHTFLRPGKNMDKWYFVFWEIPKSEISDKDGTLFLLYTVRNLIFSITENKMRFVPKLATGIQNVYLYHWKKHIFFETSKTRISKCLNTESSGAWVLQRLTLRSSIIEMS